MTTEQDVWRTGPVTTDFTHNVFVAFCCHFEEEETFKDLSHTWFVGLDGVDGRTQEGKNQGFACSRPFLKDVLRNQNVSV